nr:MAG TPA: hypothetical protein [Caudoviricetes sp.]
MLTVSGAVRLVAAPGAGGVGGWRTPWADRRRGVGGCLFSWIRFGAHFEPPPSAHFEPPSPPPRS